jgi:hypothetical protein
VRIGQHPGRLLRTAEGALTVGEQRKVTRIAGDTASRPELGKSLSPLGTPVGGNADSFAHGSDTRGPRPRRTSVGEGAIRIGIDQLTGGHEMSSHGISCRLAQRAQLGPHAAIEQGDIDVTRRRELTTAR